jgi:uncharacterized protein (DUF736 family)
MASQKIGALWKRKSEGGKTFLSGVIQDLRGDIQIAVFINDRKEKDNQPDFNIVRSEQKEEKKQGQYDDFDFGGEATEMKADDAFEQKLEEIPFA